MKQFDVKEIRECHDYQAANKLLETNDWIILDTLLDTQLCFSKVEVPNKESTGMFHKVQPFDKVITIYVLGRIND